LKAVCTGFFFRPYIPAFLILNAGLLSTWLVFQCRMPDSQSNLFHFYRNKFCFTGGYVETSVQLPGANNVLGLWPAVWTMGNLGRAGYGATLDGLVRDF
jgi:hypothetical protein